MFGFVHEDTGDGSLCRVSLVGVDDLIDPSRSAYWDASYSGSGRMNTGVYVLAHVVMHHYVTGVMAAEVSGHYGFVRVIGFCAWSEVLHPPRRGR